MATGVITPQATLHRRAVSTRSLLFASAFILATALSWHFAEIHPHLLFNHTTLVSLTQFVGSSLPPDLSATFLLTVVQASLLTVATAIASTAVAVLLAVPLGMLACSRLWRTGLVAGSRGEGLAFRAFVFMSVSVRALLGFLRAVPDLVWALLFVAVLGLGPLAGTLALSISYAGVLGRVYAEVFDAVDPQPLEALLSTGAGRVQIFLTAIWPQALPNLTAYTLYSFECCVRAAAVLGFVGAGGIGYEISLSMRLFEYHQVLTLLIAFVVILTLTDLLSRRLRGFLNGDPLSRRATLNLMRSLDTTGESSEGMDTPNKTLPGILPTQHVHRSLRRRSIAGLALCAVIVSFYFSGFLGMFTDGSLQTPLELIRFISRLLPPDLSFDFTRTLWLPLLQTLAISLLGTLIGIIFGGLLSLTATSRLILSPTEGPGRHSLVSSAARYGLYWSSRTALSILRSIPELVWALICIIAIGIGPFAGTIALGLHTTGVLGKLYADTMEEVAMRPVEALRALGARPLQLLLWAIWPQTRQLLGSYTVLRWDMNLRAATILGLVGGGGLGQLMYNDVQLGFYPRVATLILFIYALVMVTDWAGTKVWTRLAETA